MAYEGLKQPLIGYADTIIKNGWVHTFLEAVRKMQLEIPNPGVNLVPDLFSIFDKVFRTDDEDFFVMELAKNAVACSNPRCLLSPMELECVIQCSIQFWKKSKKIQREMNPPNYDRENFIDGILCGLGGVMKLLGKTGHY